MQTVILLDDPMQLFGRQSGKPFVFEVEIQQLFTRRFSRQPLGDDLPQERRLPRTTRADHRHRFATNGRHMNVPKRHFGWHDSQGIDDFLSQEIPHLSFSQG
jgi:hypothetical protein